MDRRGFFGFLGGALAAAVSPVRRVVPLAVAWGRRAPFAPRWLRYYDLAAPAKSIYPVFTPLTTEARAALSKGESKAWRAIMTGGE